MGGSCDCLLFYSVYVAKHEIFVNDVTNCFTSLKKAVNELQKAGVLTESLEMAAATVRRDTITLHGGKNVNESLFDFELDLHEPVRHSLHCLFPLTYQNSFGQFWGDISLEYYGGSELGSAFAPSQQNHSSSFDGAPLDEGLTFSFEGSPGIGRHAPGSVNKRGSSLQGPNKRDQYILNENHLYDQFSDPSFGNIGQDDGWNDFLPPNDPNARDAVFDLGLDADVFGEPGANGVLEFGTGDNAGAFGYEEYVDSSLAFRCE